MADFLNSIRWTMFGEDAIVNGINKINKAYDNHSKKMDELKAAQGIGKQFLKSPSPIQIESDKITSDFKSKTTKPGEYESELNNINRLKKAWQETNKEKEKALAGGIGGGKGKPPKEPTGPFGEKSEEEPKEPKKTKQAGLGNIFKSMMGMGAGTISGGAGGFFEGAGGVAGATGLAMAAPWLAGAGIAGYTANKMAMNEFERTQKYFGSGLSGRLGMGYKGLRDYMVKEAGPAGIPEEMTTSILQALSVSGKGKFTDWKSLRRTQEFAMQGMDPNALGSFMGVMQRAGGGSITNNMIGMAQNAFGGVPGSDKFIRYMNTTMENALVSGAIKGGKAFDKTVKDYAEGQAQIVARIAQVGGSADRALSIAEKARRAFTESGNLETPSDTFKMFALTNPEDTMLEKQIKMERGSRDDQKKVMQAIMRDTGITSNTSMKDVLANNDFTQTVKQQFTFKYGRETEEYIKAMVPVAQEKVDWTTVPSKILGKGDERGMKDYAAEQTKLLEEMDEIMRGWKNSGVKVLMDWKKDIFGTGTEDKANKFAQGVAGGAIVPKEGLNIDKKKLLDQKLAEDAFKLNTQGQFSKFNDYFEKVGDNWNTKKGVNIPESVKKEINLKTKNINKAKPQPKKKDIVDKKLTFNTGFENVTDPVFNEILNVLKGIGNNTLKGQGAPIPSQVTRNIV